MNAQIKPVIRTSVMFSCTHHFVGKLFHFWYVQTLIGVSKGFLFVFLLLLRVCICGHAHRHGAVGPHNAQRTHSPAQEVSYNNILPDKGVTFHPNTDSAHTI